MIPHDDRKAHEAGAEPPSKSARKRAALTELSRRHPQIDRDEWARRIEAARAEHVRPGSRAGAARELFRALRALFDTMPR